MRHFNVLASNPCNLLQRTSPHAASCRQLRLEARLKITSGAAHGALLKAVIKGPSLTTLLMKWDTGGTRETNAEQSAIQGVRRHWTGYIAKS